MNLEKRERAVVLLVAAVQFVNILDFVMVMPMGPDFAAALGIPASRLGMIGGSYTAAAALSGLAGSFFLDRFDRRPALGVAMVGLVCGTALGGFATGLHSLMAARVLAGLFGGPATSLAFSVVADAVPPQRRGTAMGIVMGAFSVASVLGVPAGLELARQLGWRAPFFAVAGLGTCIALCAVFLLPPMRGHLALRADQVPLRHLFSQRNVLLSWTMTFIVMAAGFIIIPNISAYVQYNLAYPRARLGLLYLYGGAVSFFATQFAGRLIDRFGSFRVGTSGTAMLVFAIVAGFVMVPPILPVAGIFVAFMLAMSFRNVSYNTLTTKVPQGAERARFMSIQSAVQHGASAAGAFLSSQLLREQPGGALIGMDQIAFISIALTLTLPFFLFTVEAAVRRPSLAALPSLE
ncbi:MAG TPA: MFS transporter [Myxococcales bacterium]|nr:MFS transporter [Myxococcales bacterium]